MHELDEIVTQHGGRFNGAAGPIRGVSARTCDMLAPAARVAELLHPEVDLQDRVERLNFELLELLSRQIKELEEEIQTMIIDDPQMKQHANILRSILGKRD